MDYEKNKTFVGDIERGLYDQKMNLYIVLRPIKA